LKNQTYPHIFFLLPSYTFACKCGCGRFSHGRWKRRQRLQHHCGRLLLLLNVLLAAVTAGDYSGVGLDSTNRLVD
jgi:hypothetical protein